MFPNVGDLICVEVGTNSDLELCGEASTIAPAHIYDTVPTILSRMNMTLPEELEGKIIEEAFDHPASMLRDEASERLISRKLQDLLSQTIWARYDQTNIDWKATSKNTRMIRN